MSKELSSAAGDVLHALFFRGALVDGDLPSKSGAAELRELGFVKAQHTMAAFRGESHYNFLTPAGQEFAIRYLVDSRFGKDRHNVRELVIKPSIDTSELQSTVNEVLDSIRNSDVFRILNGQTFINNTPIKGADVNGATIKGTVHFTGTSDQRLMQPLTDVALHINPALTRLSLTDAMRDAVIAAVRDSGQFVEKPTGDEQQARADMTERINLAVADALANALRPGGLLYARK